MGHSFYDDVCHHDQERPEQHMEAHTVPMTISRVHGRAELDARTSLFMTILVISSGSVGLFANIRPDRSAHRVAS